MNEWAKVVVSPLGLSGFALFLIFSLVAKTKMRDEQRLMRRVFLIAAVVCLAGGLGISYLEVIHTRTPPPHGQAAQSIQQQENESVQQDTTGPASPAIQDVQGNVTINNGQDFGPTHQERGGGTKGSK